MTSEAKDAKSGEPEPSGWRVHIQKHLFGLFLASLLILVVFSSYSVGSALGSLSISVLCLLLGVLVAVAFLDPKSRKFWAYLTLSIVTPALDICRALITSDASLYSVLTLVVALAYGIMVLCGLGLMTKYIMRQTKVTLDIVLGSGCIYMMIAFLFFILYESIVLSIDPHAFKGIGKFHEFELMYFSLNTLTTLGQGDIVPVSHVAQALCCLEAFAGQLFPAIFVSRLVSLYVVNELHERRDLPVKSADNKPD